MDSPSTEEPSLTVSPSKAYYCFALDMSDKYNVLGVDIGWTMNVFSAVFRLLTKALYHTLRPPAMLLERQSLLRSSIASLNLRIRWAVE